MKENKKIRKSSPTQTVEKIIQTLDRLAPPGTAERWDNVGLLVGNSQCKTRGAVLSIDLTQNALDLAIEHDFHLVITHHPCIFPKERGLSQLVWKNENDSLSSLIAKATTSGIAVITCHTNFDQCALEVTKVVSQGLGLTAQGRLLDDPGESLLKLVVFVPATHLEPVRTALCEAGAGHIGHYDFCTFSSPGEGSFRGGIKTQPFFGKPGKFEKTQEIRLETIIPQGLKRPIIQALLRVHPYEEVAYDLYPLKQTPVSLGLTWGLGYGFWGEFAQPKPFSDLAQDVKTLFKLDGFWITNPVPRQVRRLAFVAGKGTSFIGAALKAHCDLFITGEAGYHPAVEAQRQGMTVLELGHQQSERFFLSTMKHWLSQAGLESVEQDLETQKIWRGEKQ